MKQEVKRVPQRDALILPRLLEGRLIFVALPSVAQSDNGYREAAWALA